MASVLDVICNIENVLFWPFIWRGVFQHSPFMKRIFTILNYIFTMITGTVLPERIVHFHGPSPRGLVLLDRALTLHAHHTQKTSDALDGALTITKNLCAYKSKVVAEAKTKYTHEEHIDLLHKLWRYFADTTPIPGIPDGKWKTLGFQGNDPATDFRGMGLFGLKQLLCFGDSHPILAQKYYREAQIDVNWFFPVLFGINVTGFVHEMLMRGDLDVYLFEHTAQSKASTYDSVVDVVYIELYVTLCDRWLSMELDAMHFAYMFNQVKTEFMGNLKLDY